MTKPSNSTAFQFGITKPSTCSYLPDKQEELLVVIDDALDEQKLALLQTNGFRRSGDQVYRPYCSHCNACTSIRIPIEKYQFARRHKKLLNKNKDFTVEVKNSIEPDFYLLYSRYISAVHRDSTMYPPNKDQFYQFVSSSIIDQGYLCVYDGDKLISVAVTDKFKTSLSAVYTFYDPDYRDRSLGIFSIISQIKYAQENQYLYLYLGYQINQCNKMNYKSQFKPHELLLNNSWIMVN